MPERPAPQEPVAANTPIEREKLSVEGARFRVRGIREKMAAQPDLRESAKHWTDQVATLRTSMEQGEIPKKEFDHLLGTLIAEIEIEADIDQLTQLPNRRAIFNRADEIFATSARTGKPVTVAIIDLDRFKIINDENGHDTGDAVLQQAAGFIRETKRRGDFVGRWGGEEFILILPDTTKEEAGALINDRLMSGMPSAVAEALDGMTISIDQKVTASIGIADNTMGETFGETTKHADMGLYVAKERGRDRAVIYDRMVGDDGEFIDLSQIESSSTDNTKP